MDCKHVELHKEEKVNFLIHIAWNFARKTWESFWGFLSSLIVLNGILCTIYLPRNYYMLAFYFIFPSMVLFLVWLIKTERFLYKKRQVFAISIKPPDETAKTILQQALDQVRYDIDQMQLTEHIEIREIDHTQLKNRNDVRKLTKKKNVQMVLWGVIQHGCTNGIEMFHICNVVYSVRLWNIWKENQSWYQFENKLNFLMKQEDWIIHKQNSLKDVRKVAKNLSEVFLATLAISLSTKLEDIDDCIAISERLIPYLIKHIPEENRKIQINLNTEEMKGPLNVLKYGILIEILQNAYYLKGWALYDKQVHKDKAISFLQKALVINPLDGKCHELAARIFYELNDIQKAIEHTNKLQADKDQNSSYYYNIAYLSLRKGDYHTAIQNYEKLRRKFHGNDGESEKARDVVDFIRKDKDIVPDSEYLLFPIGVITYNFIDKAKGLSILEEFVAKCNFTEYSPLIGKACYIIHHSQSKNG